MYKLKEDAHKKQNKDHKLHLQITPLRVLPSHRIQISDTCNGSHIPANVVGLSSVFKIKNNVNVTGNRRNRHSSLDNSKMNFLSSKVTF